MYEKLKTASKHIKSICPVTPKIGVILGSGLGDFVKKIENPTVIPYSEIPNFGKTTVEGHEGRLIIGKVNGVDVAVMQGRLHSYEGHPMENVVFPVRVLATLGIESLVLTNAAGGINTNFRPGDLVLIDDHINMMGTNPLIGPNISELGPRFPDMTMAYTADLKECILGAAKDIGYDMKKGVYVALQGPTYETPAEIRMLRVLGGDMVGMSTVPETIAASHLGLKVCGISCITNMGAGIENKKLHHDEVKEQANMVMETFCNLLIKSIARIGKK